MRDAMGRRFPFDDLPSFKDYVGWVQVWSPDAFPSTAKQSAEEQWTLESAFDGIRLGIDTLSGGGEVSVSAHNLANGAYTDYKSNREAEAYLKLEEFRRILRRFNPPRRQRGHDD
jgi:hypothetical protein